MGKKTEKIHISNIVKALIEKTEENNIEWDNSSENPEIKVLFGYIRDYPERVIKFKLPKTLSFYKNGEIKEIITMNPYEYKELGKVVEKNFVSCD